MHDNARIIETFYGAFARRDGDAMAACYADDVTFTDPAFGTLKGERARNMWRMLTGRATDLEVKWSEVQASDTMGSARWVATYTFGATGRKVKNVISASFRFRDGKIVEHEDEFDFSMGDSDSTASPGKPKSQTQRPSTLAGNCDAAFPSHPALSAAHPSTGQPQTGCSELALDPTPLACHTKNPIKNQVKFA